MRHPENVGNFFFPKVLKRKFQQILLKEAFWALQAGFFHVSKYDTEFFFAISGNALSSSSSQQRFYQTIESKSHDARAPLLSLDLSHTNVFLPVNGWLCDWMLELEIFPQSEISRFPTCKLQVFSRKG